MKIRYRLLLLVIVCWSMRFAMLSKEPYRTRPCIKGEVARKRYKKRREESAQERIYKRHERIMQDRIHLYYTPYFSKVANPWNDYWGWPYYGMAQGNYGGNTGVVFRNGGMSFFTSNY